MEKHVFEEINRIMPHGSVTIEDVKHMHIIQKDSIAGGYDIYALQHRDLTILVYLDKDNKLTINIIMW